MDVLNPSHERLRDGTVWPAITYCGDLEWRLRYGGEVSREDALMAASIVNAYVELIRKPSRARQVIVSRLRERAAAIHRARSERPATGEGR